MLSQNLGDSRPYLSVHILGKKVLGLLDSGSNRTIINLVLFSSLEKLGIQLDTSNKLSCTVANGTECSTLGHVSLPITLKSRVKVLDVLVMPELKHSLVLGLDFWREMGLIPNINSGEWVFASSEEPQISAIIDHFGLSQEQRQKLDLLTSEYFKLMGDRLGCTKVVQHVICTDSPPIRQRAYRINPIMQKHMDAELEKMLANEVIEKSNSAWSSPALLIPKKDGSYRFCVDYRQLNKVTNPDAYPLPFMNSILDRLRNARFLSSLDIKSAYWQIEVEENSRQYTAFTVPGRGLFQFRRMPFGLSNAPATWQRFIEKVLGPELEPYVFVYLDDIVLCTPDFDSHLQVLREVLDRIFKAGLTVSAEKCKFCLPELRYLGYIVNREGICVDPEKINAILKIKAPTCVKDVRSLLGVVSWYRRFIPNFSDIVSPISDLLKKGKPFVWSESCEEAFKNIKSLLVSAPILSPPDFSLPFIVQTDASGFGLGAVLTQKHQDGEKVICYLSRSLSRQERKFGTTERECLAVLFAIEKLRPYLEGAEFSVITDHASLCWLHNLKDATGRLARWALRLQNYRFKIIHRKGKDHVVPDYLSRSVPELNEIAVQPSTAPDSWHSKMLTSVENSPLRYPNFRIIEGKLYKHIKCTYPELHAEGDNWKEVVPKPKRQALIAKCHNDPTSGHTGQFKTFKRVSSNYYWPKMKADICRYVQNCIICLEQKPEQKKTPGLMSTRPQASRPWQVICMDLVGPLPKTSKGFVYILVITDCFSKFPLMFPLRSALGKTIATLVEEQIFLLFGTPAAIICDNGTQFKCKEFVNLCNNYDTKIWYNALYHPQANPAERTNRTLKTMLSSYVKDNHRTWDLYLQKVACAIRTSVHEVTQQTPYFVNFGANHIISGGDHFRYPSEPEELNHFVSRRPEVFQKLYDDIRERLRKAHERSKHFYNLRRRPVTYQVGDLVWVKNHVLSDAAKHFTAKFAPKFVGPFRISAKRSYLVYDVDCNGVKKSYHVSAMKPHCENFTR